MSPRQRMINLMYVVLTAMLALNVSSDVLDGFHKVHESVNKSNEIVDRQNMAALDKLARIAAENPQKAAAAYSGALDVSRNAARLYNTIDSLKLLIAIKADGKKGDPNHLQAAEDLEAASVVMLNPIDRNGERLREDIVEFESLLIETLKNDSVKSQSVKRLLSTDITDGEGEAWEERKFHNQPAVAAMTMLSQLQNDIKIAEGETLRELLLSVDANDVRVNELSAFVVPHSQIVMRGQQYSADIMLAAVDTTDRPTITINGVELTDGGNTYSVPATTAGFNEYTGELTLHNPDGSWQSFPFAGSFNVIEPMATVSPTMMNVLYAGIDNPLSISVPGVPQNDIAVSASNATLTRKGNEWIARPADVSRDVEIKVSATIDGVTSPVATQKFRVRRLPDPSPYLIYTDAEGHTQNYKGGRPLAKHLLNTVPGIGAAIDDGILDIAFTVNSFETVFFDSMGNAMVEISDGPRFSQRQKDALRRLNRGKRFYISRIKATGPDGITRDIAPLEVIVN